MSDDILDQIPEAQGEKQLTLKTSQGKRFGNYVIDRIMIYLVTMGLGFLLAFIIQSIYPGTLDFIVEAEEGDLSVRLIDLVFAYVCTIIFYTVMEYFTKGKTIGKYITKTRAVRTDEENLTLRDAMMRSLSRIVPFEPFSYISNDGRDGWHDVWTDTKVIDD